MNYKTYFKLGLVFSVLLAGTALQAVGMSEQVPEEQTTRETLDEQLKQLKQQQEETMRAMQELARQYALLNKQAGGKHRTQATQMQKQVNQMKALLQQESF